MLLLLFKGLNAFSQYAEINGIINNDKEDTLNKIFVKIINTNFETSCNESGLFNFYNIPKGNYTLEFNGDKYLTKQVKVDLKEGKNNFKITLIKAHKELQEIEIIGRKEKGYRISKTFIASKSQTEIKDIPQSVAYVSKEIMADQATFRLNDIVKNMSGVNQFTTYNDLTIRGHRVSASANYASLLNGMRTYSSFWKQHLTPHIERIEVLKGPASVLFGNTSPGGTINRVTKKPLKDELKSISFQLGNFSTFRGTMDFTGPLNKSKNILYRLNLGYENAGSFRDLQFEKNYIIAPSFSFLPTKKTSINVDVVYQFSDSRLDRGQAVMGNGDLYSVPISKSLNRVNDFLKEETYSAGIYLTHRFNSIITFNTAYSHSVYSENLLEHRNANSFAVDANNKKIDSMVEMQVFNRNRIFNSDNISTYFNIDFNIGVFENKITIGYDYSQLTQEVGGSQLTASGYRNAKNTGFIKYYNKLNKSAYLLDNKGNPVPNVPHFNLKDENPYYIADMSKYFYKNEKYAPTFYSSQGIYIQEQLKIWRFQILLAIRKDFFTDFENYNTSKEKKIIQTAILPRFGLIYSVNKNINIYTTYVKGYQPQSNSILANPNSGGPFDPLYSSLIETGVKTEWFNKSLTTTLSIYKLTVDGALYNAGVSGKPDLMTQIGQEESKGFEIDAIGHITNNLHIICNYSYNEAIITKSKNASDIGRQKPNAPYNQGNIWIKYNFNNEILSGLGLAVGFNFVSQRLGSIVSKNEKPQQIPSYYLFNAGIYYQLQNIKFQINVNNVLNQTYWAGGYDKIRMFPGQPRNFLFTISYLF